MPQYRRENAAFSFSPLDDAAPRASAPANSIKAYRDRAAKLRALAAESLDAEIRRHLLATAAQFQRLADCAAASGSNTHAA